MSKRTVQANGKKIEQLRKARGWSQEQLCAKAKGLSLRTLARVEASERVFPATLLEIANAFGVPMEEITDKDGLSEDEHEIFVQLGKGSLGLMIEWAKRDGFILVSENDAKEYLLWFCEQTLPREMGQERIDECRKKISEQFADATDEPADYALHIITSTKLKAWLEEETSELVDMAKEHLKDYKAIGPDELERQANIIINSHDPLIAYFDLAWRLVESAIEDRSGGVAWWKSLSALQRKCVISQGAINVIKKMRYILHQMYRSQSVLTKEMASLVAQYASVGMYAWCEIHPPENKDA